MFDEYGKTVGNYEYVPAVKFISSLAPDMSYQRFGSCYDKISPPMLISLGRTNYLNLLGSQIAYINYMSYHNLDMLLNMILGDDIDHHEKALTLSTLNKDKKIYPYGSENIYYINGEQVVTQSIDTVDTIIFDEDAIDV